MLFEQIQLEADEDIIIVVRKHWFRIFARSFGILVTALIPLFGWLAISRLTTTETATISIDLSAYTIQFIYLYSAWLLLNWMALAYAWTDHYLDLWTITDRRVIKIDQVTFFNRQIGSFRLEKLQDMNIEINGIIATFLDFGTLEAQTASGSEEEFQAEYLPNPRELKAIILKAADERMRTRHDSTSMEAEEINHGEV